MLYQHKPRGGNSEWQETAKERFHAAVGHDITVHVIDCKEIASDVVFFAVERSKLNESLPTEAASANRRMAMVGNEEVITNAEKLTAAEVIGRRVLCPACHKKEFKTWPMGWDSHVAHACPGVSGDTQSQRKALFKNTFAHLFKV